MNIFFIQIASQIYYKRSKFSPINQSPMLSSFANFENTKSSTDLDFLVSSQTRKGGQAIVKMRKIRPLQTRKDYFFELVQKHLKGFIHSYQNPNHPNKT